MKIMVLCGLPGIGKSTFAKSKYCKNATVVNLDTLKSRKEEDILIEECIFMNKTIVVDNTNVLASSRYKYIKYAKKHNIEIECYYFLPKKQKALERNKQRIGKRKVPDVVIHKMYKDFETPMFKEGFNRIYKVCDDNNITKVVRMSEGDDVKEYDRFYEERESAKKGKKKTSSKVKSKNANKCEVKIVEKKKTNFAEANSIIEEKELNLYAYVLANKVDNRIYVSARSNFTNKEELLEDLLRVIYKKSKSSLLRDIVDDLGRENMYIKKIYKIKTKGTTQKKSVIARIVEENGAICMVQEQKDTLDIAKEYNSTISSYEELVI